MEHDNIEVEEAITQLLASSERAKSIISVLSVPSAPSGENEGPAVSSASEVHILVAVSNNEGAVEEGSVFIFRSVLVPHQVQSDTIIEYQLRATLPLTSDLNISMAQSRSRSGTVDLRAGKYTPAQPSVFTLTLSYGRREWSFSTSSSEALAALVTECRRLVNISNSSPHLDFRWLNKYQSHRQLQAPTLFPRSDLRKLQKPKQSLLSSAAAGQPGVEDVDLPVILDDWLRSKVEEDRNIFTQTRSIRIRLGTFNVNGNTPSQDLAPWIRPQHKNPPEKSTLPSLKSISPISLSSFTGSDYLSARPLDPVSGDDLPNYDPDGEPDVYVLGFQELDLSTEALIYSYTTVREDMWTEAIFAALGEVRGQYKKLVSKQLVGMLIICIVKNDLVKDIRDVGTCAVGTGIMGMMGNKGAAALRFTLDSTVMTFVNAHLAAFDEYIERRNADFHDLSRRLLFVSPTETSSQTEAVEQLSESIFQSDVLFWEVSTMFEAVALDPTHLNYRIDLPDAEVRELISGDLQTRKYDIRDMLSQDQLTKSRLEGKAFEDFIEGEISDLPSYRFSSGIATDTNGYDLKRRPAFTDRILYQISPRTRYRQTKYSIHPELTMSDHKPVSAEFCMTVRHADESGYYNQLRKLIEQLEDLIIDSEVTPKLKMVTSEIYFGDVRYKQKTTRQLKFQNTGKVPCAFRFVSLSENEPAFKPWLSASPLMGIVLPDEEVSISISVFVDETTAPALNNGTDKLHQTLILHTLRGKDHFIVLNGDYKRTCFANYLSTLVRLPGSVRESGVIEESLSEKPKTRTNAPREVMRLINWLMTNATSVPDLFVSHGDIKIIESIRESLDTGEEFNFDFEHMPETEKHTLALSFADALLEFFQVLPISVIPASLQERCALVTDRDEAFEVISSELPGYVLNVWISLTAFLHFIAQQRSSTVVDQGRPNENTRASVLACIFAPVLLRDEPRTTVRITPLAKRRFLLHFIQ